MFITNEMRETHLNKICLIPEWTVYPKCVLSTPKTHRREKIRAHKMGGDARFENQILFSKDIYECNEKPREGKLQRDGDEIEQE